MISLWRSIDLTPAFAKPFERYGGSVQHQDYMGSLTWLLGLQKTWLVQDAFIDKVCARFGIETVGRSPDVPLTEMIATVYK
jgi:hypothetical protein